jgi:outer membrane protein OmpA-like peptidoglycan-associated protein
VIQYIFQLIGFLAVLSIAGCASTPEPVSPVGKPTPPAVAEPEAPSTTTETQVIASVKPENNVFFAQGSSAIDETGKATLRLHAERLKANPKTRVTLIGHAESFGSRAMSIAIADKRVSVVPMPNCERMAYRHANCYVPIWVSKRTAKPVNLRIAGP